VTGQCPRCEVGIDMERQCTLLSEPLVIDSVTDPFTGEEWMIAYCRTCAIALWPEIAEEAA
jgi:hypothetical protein